MKKLKILDKSLIFIDNPMISVGFMIFDQIRCGSLLFVEGFSKKYQNIF
jgi:hypothetical protein